MDCLESSLDHKVLLGGGVVLEGLGELLEDIQQNFVWSQLDEGLQGLEVVALVQDLDESVLGLLLEVSARLFHHVDSKEITWDIVFGHCLGMAS